MTDMVSGSFSNEVSVEDIDIIDIVPSTNVSNIDGKKALLGRIRQRAFIQRWRIAGNIVVFFRRNIQQ